MHKVIKAAQKYSHTDELCVISCFYNPNSYKTKPANYNAFIERMEISNLSYLIVECAFDKQSFALKKSKNIIRLRTSDVMWQKERLLNVAIENIPPKYKKIAWLDCDVLFENPDWAVETVHQLKHYKIVQPFKMAIRLPKNTDHYAGVGKRYLSFAYVVRTNPSLLKEAKYALHGHTGFAWASHTSLLKKHGLYDVCIAGAADHLMAHSFIGDWNAKCLNRMLGNNSDYFLHYKNWSKKVYQDVKSKVNYVDGTLLHLWHGDKKDRAHIEREHIINKHMFNPLTDIKMNATKCWDWSSDDKELIKWIREYFVRRKED